MDSKTVQYKRTLRGSIGAGAGALFNGNGRRYYILEHKSASKYHRAGESQKIIVDQAELGRGEKCQVRFDGDTFPTVSRRHAAIVKDGDGWKIVHLSTTNSTLVNGQRVETERPLHNGDEIQLSVGGPRMGFIVPAGKQGLVSSIRMTERFELFRKQALKPYKRAITALTVCLVLAVGGLTTWNILQKQDFDSKIAKANEDLDSIRGKNAELDSLIALGQIEQRKQDSLLRVYKNQSKRSVVVYPTNELSDLLKHVEKDVFYIEARVFAIYNGERMEIPNYGWSGTGFLTTDGNFITARHCVEGWKYKMPSDTIALKYLITAESLDGCEIVSEITAYSEAKTLHFTSKQFDMEHNGETRIPLGNGYSFVKAAINYTDWACANAGVKGSIVVDKQLAANLPIGADLHLLGFPLGMGAVDTHSLTPLYGSCKTSKHGLEDGVIRISARNYESGNSGGPVFYNNKGKLIAVGIVSYSVGSSSHGGIVSLSNIR